MRQFSVFLIILTISFFGSIRIQYTYPTVTVGYVYDDFSVSEEDSATNNTLSSITFVGDVMLARHVETYLDAYGSDYVYSDLPPLSTSTTLVGNFEGSIPSKHIHTPDNTFTFSVDSVHVNALKNYGFEYMNLANNHSFDYGKNGYIQTKQTLTDTNILSFGHPKTISSSSVVYIETADATIAVIGINTINETFEIDAFKKVMDFVSTNSDFQVVYIHWGTEYTALHSKEQESIAYGMIDVGIDAIIGHHPHVVQDIEFYKNVPIFYSLGNFIFDQYFSEEVQNGLLLKMYPKNNTLTFQLQGITSIGSQSVPRLMSLHENDFFLNKLAKRSSLDIKEMIENGYITTE